VGEQHGSKFLILDGIKPGERVIVEGIQKAREGFPVKPMTAGEIAAMKASHATGAHPAKP
jgi:membrane fusion protein (multidrug efflux system)